MIKTIDMRIYDNKDGTYDVMPIADNGGVITLLPVPEEDLDEILADMKRSYREAFGDVEFTETIVE